MTKHLLCLGYGYSAQAFANHCIGTGWHVSGTTRSATRTAAIGAAGITPLIFEGTEQSTSVSNAIANATHILISIAPDTDGDTVLRHYSDHIADSSALEWIGYLSTVGVYGNHNGAWVDEETPAAPTSERSKRRVEVECSWLDFCRPHNIPLQIFRLSGIYGPGRSAVDKLRSGTARRLIKPAQVFNRIHVGDIARALITASARPEVSGIFNVTDDLPASPQDVIQFAAELIGLEVPPDIAFETADLSPMARSFYSENKRVRNHKIKQELGFSLEFPTYREGIAAIASQN